MSDLTFYRSETEDRSRRYAAIQVHGDRRLILIGRSLFKHEIESKAFNNETAAKKFLKEHGYTKMDL